MGFDACTFCLGLFCCPFIWRQTAFRKSTSAGLGGDVINSDTAYNSTDPNTRGIFGKGRGYVESLASYDKKGEVQTLK